MSRLKNFSSKTSQSVGPGVGSVEMVGWVDTVGADDGELEKIGDADGLLVGLDEIMALEDGMVEIVGLGEGDVNGLLVGMVEIVGLEDGMAEIVGLKDGVKDGASLCGKAPAIIKSDAVAVVASATA